MKQYVLAVDQSTQGTKALILDGSGKVLCRADRPHRQIVSENGWVSHDLEEIYENTLLVARDAVDRSGIALEDIACVGISNQRETTAAWDERTGKPICDAIVWQCSRAEGICRRVQDAGYGPMIRQRTGIPASPYFPAAKMAWILENIPAARDAELRFGTIDAWLVYKLTGEYKTDYSNASRTQLFNILEMKWDEELCAIFGVKSENLPQVCDSDSMFGMTDLGGLLQEKIPVHAVMGDSHAALFGQGCTATGMAKATYGTGSSVMMNVGPAPVFSQNGLATSLAWKHRGETSYVLEGNINYTGAVISWLKDDVKLIESAGETDKLARQANPEDRTCLVPAFSGLGAPYWCNDARALLWGMSRLTGKAEIVRAALECIAFQITDVILAMEQDTGKKMESLRVDGGPTKNNYLMEFQQGILQRQVHISQTEELSACGAGYMAGIAVGLWSEDILQIVRRSSVVSTMTRSQAEEKRGLWKEAVDMVRK